MIRLYSEAAMRAWYQLLYQIGLTPWEQDSTEGAAARQIAALFAREESARRPPYGPALDLGCGSGVWAVTLAVRGWQVTGIDIVAKAVGAARARAQAAGVEARFVRGDVTALRSAGVGTGFRLVLDFECFNHLNDAQRSAVGREVNAVTSSGATLLLLAWARGRRWPLPAGANRRDIEHAFPGWVVIGEDAYAAQSELPRWLLKTDLRFYRLRRGTTMDSGVHDASAPGRAADA